jgi:hypothetical protein
VAAHEATLAAEGALHVQTVLDRRDGCEALDMYSGDAGGVSLTTTGQVGAVGVTSPSSIVGSQQRVSRRLETGLPPGSVVYVASVPSLVVLNDAEGKRVALYTVRVHQTRPTAAEWTCRRR